VGETRIAPILFSVVRDRSLGDEDLRNLLQLYVPFLGPEAFTLYLFWMHMADGDEMAHAELLTQLRLSEANFLRARRRLEGVGLVRSFLQERERGYTYLLLPPLSPREFLASDILPALLRRAIGEERFREMFRAVNIPPDPQVSGREITVPFGEAYPEYDLKNLFEALQGFGRAGDRRVSPSVGVFSRVRAGDKIGDSNGTSSLSTSPWPPEVLEGGARFLKRESSSTEEGTFHFLEGTDPALAEDKGVTLIPQSTSEVVANFKAFSPYDLLRHYQGVHELSPADQRLVDDLLYVYHLPPEVVNVLIDYILLLKDKTFPRAFTEKVAATFARQGLRTADEALAFLQRYHRKRRVTGVTSGTPGRRGTSDQFSGLSAGSRPRNEGRRNQRERSQAPGRVPVYIRLEDVLGEGPSEPEIDP